MGKNTISLNNGKGKAYDVLFVDGLKHNLLSVSWMCNKGYDAIFRAQECEIILDITGKMLAKGI